MVGNLPGIHHVCIHNRLHYLYLVVTKLIPLESTLISQATMFYGRKGRCRAGSRRRKVLNTDDASALIHITHPPFSVTKGASQ